MESEETKVVSCQFLQVINSSLKTLFANLGHSIAKNPSHFITVPILLSLLLGTGMQQFIFVNNPEYLFSPLDGPSHRERELVESIFPLNLSTRFDPSRLTRPGRAARILITAQDGGSLLHTSIWREIKTLDKIIRGVQIQDQEQVHTYENLCVRWQDDCYSWNVLELGDMMDEIEAKNLTLTFPLWMSPSNFQTYSFPMTIGGMKLSNESTIESFKALQVMYFIDNGSPTKDARGAKWEAAVLAALEKADDQWALIKVDRFTWWTLGEEVDRNNLSAIPYMFITVPFMILFAAGTCMMSDWVRSKPLLGIAGVICPALGSLAAFGFLGYCRVPLCSINIATPFLMLGIGIDDTFVMLGAWRQTSVHDPVTKRMGQAFSEAGVSITITSLTDMLSFWVGVMTPFPAVQIFSLYTGTAVLGTFLCHIFIFGGAMALSGYYEAENRHGLLWWRECTPKSVMNSTSHSWFYKKFWTGGLDPTDPQNPVNNPSNAFMIFFRDRWALYINHPVVKATILFGFLIYIAVSCWGISRTREGLDLVKLARFDSYAAQSFSTDARYFRSYPYRIQIVISGDVDYSNKTVQHRIESMMQQFEASPFVGEGAVHSQSWLRGFLALIDHYKTMEIDLNVTGEVNFIQSLQENYLSPDFVLSDDIIFNEDRNKIVASRFIIQGVNVTGSNEDIAMVTSLREIAEAQSPHLNVTVFNWYFIFFDQFMIIRSTTIQCVTVAGVIMMIVSLLLIPNPLCSLWVTFSIVSIEAGVLGFLALWNVNLDVISMISCVMCIGFSVDFSAHISYAYMAANCETPEERLRSCFYSLGVPIVQGALSTILGVMTLILVPSYIHNTFFKAVVLVMIIAAMHGLLLLPVLLSLFGPGSPKILKKLKHNQDETKL